jgi:hypothetical protein
MSPILGSRGGISASAYGLFGAAGEINSYESIATVTVGAGGQSSITFSSIPSTYKHLQLRAFSYAAATNQGYFLQINGDTGTTNYNTHYVYGDGSSALAGANSTWAGIDIAPTASSSSYGTAIVVDILDYTNTNKNKTIRSLQGSDANGAGNVGLFSGLWQNTSAITSLVIRENLSGLDINQYSSFALYGIKG